MKTIFYLIDLAENRVIKSYGGEGNKPPRKAIKEAEKRSKETGHSCSVAFSTHHSNVDRGWKPKELPHIDKLVEKICVVDRTRGIIVR